MTRPRFLPFLLAFLAAFAASTSADARVPQDDAAQATETAPVAADVAQSDAERVASRIEDLRARLADLDGQSDLSPAAVERARSAYTEAITRLESARDLIRKRKTLEAIGQGTAPDPATTPPDPLPSVPPDDAELGTLQQVRDDLSVTVGQAEARVSAIDDQLATLEERRDAVGPELTEARAALSALRNRDTSEDASIDARVSAALRARQAAQVTELEARIATAIVENDSSPRVQETLQAERKTVQARLDSARSRLEVVQTRLVEDTRLRAQSEVAQAEAAVAGAAAPVADVARKNLEIARSRLGHVDANADLIERNRRESREVETLRHRFEALSRRAAKALSTQQIAALLRKERQQLEDPRAIEREMASLLEEQSTLDLAALDLADRIDALERGEGDPATEDDEADARRADPSAYSALLAERLALLRENKEAIDERVSELSTLEATMGVKRTIARSLRDFVEERVLWVRSTEPAWALRPGDFRRAAATYLSLERVRAMPPAALDGLFGHPLKSIGLLLLGAGLVWLRRRLGARIDRRTGPDATPEERRRTALSIGPTLEQLVRSIAGALQLPVLLSAFVLPLRDHAAPGSILQTVAAGLIATLPAWFALDLARRIARPGGLGEVQLSWGAENMATLRRHLRWFTPTFLLLAVLAATVHSSGNQPLIDTFGRIFFDAKLIAVAGFLALLLRADGLHSDEARQSVLARLRGVWFTLGVGSCALLVLGSVLGYHYSARNLWEPFEATVALLSGLLVLRAVVARWILVNRRRLRIDQARERRARAEVEAEKAAQKSGVPAEHATVEPEPETAIDLGSLEEEMGELLRFVTGGTAFLGIAVIWKDFIPALGRLREVVVWSNDAGQATTLWDLGAAVLLFALAVVLGKRLPGLLEFTVLNRFKLGGGERYAIRALVTYVVLAIGTVAALGTLGLTWGSVQWLAAAVSVGLGFGLQEIFANFVSGLILLFERPIRVGDLVTVAGTEGRVTQIRIRATTILDYDRREMIVPNREFVTGSLVNWTLSDPITRLVVKVGVAYGSDVDKARSLMVQAAKECKQVLREPAPSVVFKGFGDSSLDFDVRVFMADRDHWPQVIDFVHARIDTLFRENGIEIPFPQRDLHVRTAAPEILEVFGRGPSTNE